MNELDYLYDSFARSLELPLTGTYQQRTCRDVPLMTVNDI
jgi:hypothetical protein